MFLVLLPLQAFTPLCKKTKEVAFNNANCVFLVAGSDSLSDVHRFCSCLCIIVVEDTPDLATQLWQFSRGYIREGTLF